MKRDEISNARASALADEDSFWTVGHELNEASGVLSRWNGAGEFNGSGHVGEPVWGLVNPSGFYYEWRRSLIVEMLYAFAVENWLKGLLVASYERGSEVMQRSIQSPISKLVDANPAEEVTHTEKSSRHSRTKA